MRAPLALTALALSSLTIGCGLGSAPVNDAIAGTAISGRVHGGQQPISGSSVQLYQVGTTGYGLGAVAVGNAVTTLADGSFTLTGAYTCPSPSTLVYIVASSGNPGNATAGSGGNNAAIRLMSALGACGNLTSGTSIFINELTTVAAAEAMSQYFGRATDGFGAPNNTQAQTGLLNAFTTAATLVNTSAGTANTTLTTNGAGGALTITPEAAKLSTIADIIAACVNSAPGTAGDAGACTTLFADSGPTGVTPTDTLQAAVLMNTNPTSNNANGSTSNITALYGLITSNAPYTAQATQPTDWTVGIQYTGTATTMNLPQNVAIDASGNVWVVNNNNGSGGSLNEITPGGSMLVDNTLVSGAVTGSTLNPRNVAIDLNNNVWVPTSSSTGVVFELTSTGVLNSLAIGKAPYGIAIDASNNVWVSQESSTAVTSFTEFLGGTLAATAQVGYPVIGSTTSLPSYLAFDANGTLWASSGANLATASNIVEVTGTSSASCATFPCTTGAATYTNITGLGAEPFGLAGSATNLWVAGAVGNVVSSVSTGATPAPTNYGSTASLSTPRYPAVDGAGNIWVTNRGTGGITEFSSNGTILSPVAAGAATTIGFAHAGITSGNGIGIDPSGNVWIANNTVNAPNANSIFEIVGAASPAVTPLAQALQTNSYGVRP